MRNAVIVVMALVLAVSVCAADQMWIPRVEQQGNLMVPIRPVFEPFGAEIGWNPTTGSVLIMAPAMNIVVKPNSTAATVNGTVTQLPVAPQTISGETWLPFSFAETQLEGKIEYAGDRIDMPTVGRTLMLRGGAGTFAAPTTSTQTSGTGTAGGQTGAAQAASGQLSITQPTEGATVGPRVEVYGTAPGGSLLVIETEVRAQDDDELLRVVPGIRHAVPASGNWHFSVAAPELPENMAEPLYYVIKAEYRTPSQSSETVSVKVFRADQ